MPTAMLPSTPPVDFAVQLTVPAPGDTVGSVTGPAPLNPSLQALLDATEAARLSLLGGGIRRRVFSADGATVNIQPMGSIVVVIGGVTQVLAHTAFTTVNLSAGLVADARYWFYVTITAGAAVFSKSTTAPDDNLHYMTGDQSKLYVSTFMTNDSGGICAYTQTDNVYTYTAFFAPGGGVHANLILDEGVATGITGVLTAPAAPAQASSLIVQIEFRATNSSDFGFVGVDPIAVVGWYEHSFIVPGKLQGQITISNKDGLVFYRVASALYDTMSLWVAGFTL